MAELTLMKAQPVDAGQVIPDLSLQVAAWELPSHWTPEGVEEFYQEQADCLGRALARSLPQATMHQLLVWLLQRYACLYVGPMPKPVKER
jgi:hypothetical protein